MNHVFIHSVQDQSALVEAVYATIVGSLTAQGAFMLDFEGRMSDL